MRDIVTTEIKNELLEIAKGTSKVSVPQFLKNVDPTSFEIVNEIRDIYVNRIGKSIEQIFTDYSIDVSSDLNSDILRELKRGIGTALCTGWFLEHVARNNIQLKKAPSVGKYISSGIAARGSIEEFKSLLQNTKETKESKRAVKNHDTFMNMIES